MCARTDTVCVTIKYLLFQFQFIWLLATCKREGIREKLTKATYGWINMKYWPDRVRLEGNVHWPLEEIERDELRNDKLNQYLSCFIIN